MGLFSFWEQLFPNYPTFGGVAGNQAATSTTQDRPTRPPTLFHMWRIDYAPAAVKLGNLGKPADKIWEQLFPN